MEEKPAVKPTGRRVPARGAPEDFYRSWRRRVRAWGRQKKLPPRLLDVGLALPDLLHLLTRLLGDSRVPLADKAKIGVAVLYLASPIDLLPEVLFGPAGFLDDIAVVVWALSGLLREEHWDVIEEHWAGDAQIVDVLTRALSFVDENLGAGRWRRVRALLARVSEALPPARPAHKGRASPKEPQGDGPAG